MVRAIAIVLFLLAGCQQMPGDNALPACTSNCILVVIGSQDRGEQSGQATATVRPGLLP
jgi:hypothetical protein